MKSLRDLAVRIDAFSIRERALLLITVLAALYFGWQGWLMAPLGAERIAAGERIGDVRMELAVLNQKARIIVGRQAADPDDKGRRELTRLQGQLEGVKEELAELTTALVEPQKMAGVLESVLVSSRAVRFVSLEGLGASPLLEPVSSADPAPGKGNGGTTGVPGGAFKHGLELRVEGGYLDTLEVLRRLESLPWGLFWESIDLQVGEYPSTRTAITVFTLSWRAEWIGV